MCIALKAVTSSSEVSSIILWTNKGGRVKYGAGGGGRDVLILAPNLSLPHPEAVPRRPGQLTQEDKLELQSQGLPPDCIDELAIVRARWKLDKRYRVLKVHSGESLCRKEIIEGIAHLLNTTQNDGGKFHLSVSTTTGIQTAK